jgi:hypothetical protein
VAGRGLEPPPRWEKKGMAFRIGRAIVTALVLGTVVARAMRTAPDAAADVPAEDDAKSVDVAKTSRRFMNFVLLPIWMLSGFGDYLCHRASKIERTSGTHESLTHMLMISSTGIGIAAALVFEVNETVLAVMTASAVAHEAVVLWDIGYATPLRPPSPTEQHMHSFLEVLPFTALAFMVCLNPDDLAVLLGRGSRPRRFRLEPKRHPAAPLYGAAVISLALFMLFLPYTEELVRCYRTDHTFLPHDRPIDS